MIRSERAHLHLAALSHPGAKGKNNEDRYAVSSYFLSQKDETPVLFAVIADGIGGHRAGEVAAELTVDHISHAIAKSNARHPLKIMQRAIHAASEAIAAHGGTNQDQHGMGATCACVWVIGDRLFTASVGDTRIYFVRDRKIQQLTVDHTWVQEAIDKGILNSEKARDHPNAHIIRRHLGSVPPPEVDTRMRLSQDENDLLAHSNQGMVLRSGDKLLMCTDGLTDLVRDDEIFRIIHSTKDLKKTAEGLVDLANRRGGHDNITVILLAMPEPEEGKLSHWWDRLRLP